MNCQVKVQPSKSKHFKYCPVTSVDVERTFSAFKIILDDKRENFSIENFEKHIIVHCNLNYKYIFLCNNEKNNIVFIHKFFS